MNLLQNWLSAGPLVTDGAWGTELLKRGVTSRSVPDIWNLDRPEAVEEVAAAYVQAGSRVILTNTFRSNPITLAGHGLDGKTEELNRAGVAISKKAAAGRALVFASIGPTGKLLVAKEVAPADVEAAFGRQAAALAGAGADALLVETMSDLEEARLAVAAACKTGLPVLVSFAFDSGRNKDRTMTGATAEQVARGAEEWGASGVGANCGTGIDRFADICSRMRAVCKLPLWMKPNAGMPTFENGRTEYSMTAESFAGQVAPLVESGASFLGGCCGSNPEFIRALAERVRKCVSS